MPKALLLRDRTAYGTHGAARNDVFARNTSTPLVAPASLAGLLTSGTQPSDALVFNLNAAVSPGTADFCAEGFFRYPNVPAGLTTTVVHLGAGFSNLALVVQATTGLFQTVLSGTSTNTSTSLAANTAYHWAVSRQSGTVKWWLGGNLIQTLTAAASMGGGAFSLGYSPFGTSATPAEFSGLRFTSGNARYTAAFSPPTAAFGVGSGNDALWSSVPLMSNFEDVAVVNNAVGPSLCVRPSTTGLPLLNVHPKIGYSGVSRIKGRDQTFGGLYMLSGTVKQLATPSNLPLYRHVRLFDERTGIFIDSTWSDAVTGAYAFTNIKGNVRYTVVAFDYPHGFRAVVADNILPVPMT